MIHAVVRRAVLMLLPLIPAVGSAGEWPQWRGTTQDGFAHEEDLAEEWPADGPAVLWTREIGKGYSAFVVADGRAYTQAQSLYEQSLICLDAETGEQIWSHSYGWPYDGGGLYPGPRATPTVAEDHVYIAAPEGTIGCVNAETGSPVWSVNLKAQHRGRGTDFGVSASPVVWRGKVIVPLGGPEASLVSLDARTGEIVWKCGELPASYATPIVVPFQDRWLVIAPLENSLLCADAETGERLWELDLSAGYDEHSAAPLYREPYLMLAGPFRSGATCYKLIGDAETGECHAEPVWASQKFSNDIASSVLVGDHIFGFDLKDAQSRLHRPSRGEFRCLNWSDGKEQWSSSEPGHANIIVANDKLLLFNDRGELRLARISGDGYEELAQASVFTDEICWTPPALANGRVYLRTQTRAACLYLGRQPLKTTQSVQTVAAIPQVSRFDPTSLVGGEREFPAATPEWYELKSWYAWTLGGIVLMWLAIGMISLLMRPFRRPAQPALAESRRLIRERVRATAFWMGVLAWGAFGSAAINPRQAEFLFTWPLVLWGLMQVAAESAVSALVLRPNRRAAWIARGMMLLFVLGCGLYFHLCRKLGLATEWSYLTGFAAACPVAMLCDWLLRRTRMNGFFARLPIWLLSYSIYFWASVCFMKWRLRVGS